MTRTRETVETPARFPTVRRAAEHWAEEAVREALRQGWVGGSDAGNVEEGVCGVEYPGLIEAVQSALGRPATLVEVGDAMQAAYETACDRLDDTDWRADEPRNTQEVTP